MGKIVKRVLTRNGIQYFDAGGTVLPPQATTIGAAPPNAQAPGVVGDFLSGNTTNPGPGIVKTATKGIEQAAQPLNDAIQSVANNAGGIAKGFASAFTAQNDYNAALAPQLTTDYSGYIPGAIGTAGAGYGQFGSNQAQQQQMIQALLGEANGPLAQEAAGLGPNPAQAALNANTGANVAATQAAIAGARGGSANAGLQARQAAQAGAGIQQGAIGQAATLQAQQQLAAQQQKIAAEHAAAQLTQGQGTQIVGEQQANTGLVNALTGAQNKQNENEINNFSMAQGINSQVAQNNANSVNKTLGGLTGGVGALFSMFAKGGMVMPDHFKHLAKIYHPEKLADGGMIQVPNFVTPPSDGKSGGMGNGIEGLLGALPEKDGGTIPGKAAVKGNSFKNDKVVALVSPKEIVLPRSITMAPDAPERAKEFVAEELAKHYGTHDDDVDDFKEALKKAISTRKTGHAAH